jgi:predicted O-linked N-acetylglucosamine transferase (SPINDLY family)
MDTHTEQDLQTEATVLHQARLLVRQGQQNAAEMLLRDLSDRNHSPVVLNELGNLCKAGGRLREAHDCYERALQADENNARIMSNLAGVLSLLGDTPTALDLLNRALTIAPENPQIRSNYLMHLHYRATLDPERLFAEHRHARCGYPGEVARPTPTAPKPDRPLRIGYIGPDFRRHSVACFFEPLLQGADAQAEHITLYANVPAPDDTSRRLASRADAWVDIAELDDDQVARRIRDDAIDILIDLAGHTQGNRLGVLARRAAPLQGTYLGYPDTTGLSCVDFRISDALADPPGNESFCTERLVRLDRCFLCYRPPDIMATAEPALPSESAGCVTFGAFCTQQKINDNLLALWSGVLQAVPDSRLLLKLRGSDADGLEDLYLRKCHAVDIDPQRVSVAPASSYEDHLAMHRFVDIMLDTYPYNGTTATCEALCLGVPVISLVGRHHASRVGLSLLTAAGLDVLAANTPQEYVTLGVSMARNIDARRILRTHLREQLQANGLCDPPAFAEAFRRQLRNIWQEHLVTLAAG